MDELTSEYNMVTSYLTDGGSRGTSQRRETINCRASRKSSKLAWRTKEISKRSEPHVRS